MKTILFLVAACFAFASCQTNVKNEATAQAQKKSLSATTWKYCISMETALCYLHGH